MVCCIFLLLCFIAYLHSVAHIAWVFGFGFEAGLTLAKCYTTTTINQTLVSTNFVHNRLRVPFDQWGL
jgi:hypothetical protein